MDGDEERRLQEQSSLQDAEFLALNNMQEFCTIAESTKNPVFLWKAMSSWFDANLAHQKLGFERLEMPQQFRTYLAMVSKRLSDLSEGLDYRKTPEPFGELPRVWASVEVARGRTRTLDTSQATKLALHAFGLRRNGWNAFERAVALGEQDLDALSHGVYRIVGDMGEGETIEALLEDHATTKATRRGRPVLEDARGLRKRIKASRDARRSK